MFNTVEFIKMIDLPIFSYMMYYAVISIKAMNRKNFHLDDYLPNNNTENT